MRGYETRCYAITGSESTLEALEGILRRMETVTARRQLRLVSVFVDGRAGASLTVRRLASWREEAGLEELAGSLLARLEDEDTVQACFLHDVK